jgi:hypothetical protein
MSVPNTPFAQACQAWYATARKDDDFGADDTEPRAEFAEIVCCLARNVALPHLPRTAADWQLYTGEGTGRGAGLVASRLTKAARKVVAAADGHLDDVRAYCEYQGWWY